MAQPLKKSLQVGLLLSVPALIAWLTGRPFLFPSLGPSAYSLILTDQEESSRRVIGGHVIGVVGGLIAYHLISGSLSITELPSSHSVYLLRIAVSGILSVILTTSGMIVCRAEHPPACATTLIVSLGLLSSFWDALFIMVAVTIMYYVHLLLLRLCHWR